MSRSLARGILSSMSQKIDKQVRDVEYSQICTKISTILNDKISFDSGIDEDTVNQ